MSEDKLRALFWHRAQNTHICLVEGNRGLFDGKDLEGSCSTAALARLLDTPIVLVMDCTKMTRTAAAVLVGCLNFEKDTPIAGVVCNRIAGARHQEMVRKCIEHYTDIPVLGALPKTKTPIPERHMGLWSTMETDDQDDVLDGLADLIESHCDTDAMLEVANNAPDAPGALEIGRSLWTTEPATSGPRIGVVRDAALWFYYEENIEALRRAGAEIVEVSILSGDDWPEITGLYLGGGFPETNAEALARNTRVRQRVRQMVEMGMPVYAECGGFMYLCESIATQEGRMPMVGVFPIHVELSKRPQGLGYVEATVDHETPFFSKGATIQGHEFHYSCAKAKDGAELTFALKLGRGEGILAGYDGLVYKETFASYTHIHALGAPDWAPNFVEAASRFSEGLL